MSAAKFYKIDRETGVISCKLCPVGCIIKAGQTGFCGARKNENGSLKAGYYGRLSSIALDSIEKKPLYHFYSGTKILSVGSFGCNMHCSFCQNHGISMHKPGFIELDDEYYSPKLIAKAAEKYIPDGNIGVAYTYNEPFINYEFMYDCCVRVRERELKNVIVTNGYVNPEPLRELLPYVDAMNIDIKSFRESFYKTMGGKLSDVKKTVESAARHCHVELTSLIIPGENDNLEEMENEAKWIAGINDEIPLHLSRFFPNYRMTDKAPTDIAVLEALQKAAQKYLKHVYLGNIN